MTILLVTSVPPIEPSNVDVSVINNDAIITWDAVTQDVYENPITPDGYVV